VDTQTSLGWHNDPDVLGPATVITMGFVVGEDDRFLKLAPTISTNCFADPTVIIKSSILHRKTIKVDAIEKWLGRG
jgi:hypothetical protein